MKLGASFRGRSGFALPPARSPWHRAALHFRGDIAAVSSQCFTNPLLGPLMLNLLEQGFTPQQTIEVLRIKDEHFEYRQIGIVTPSGEIAVHSGQHGKPYRARYR